MEPTTEDIELAKFTLQIILPLSNVLETARRMFINVSDIEMSVKPELWDALAEYSTQNDIGDDLMIDGETIVAVLHTHMPARLRVQKLPF